MKKYEHPRTAYILTRGCNVRKVTLVRPYSQTSNWGGYTKGGQYYAERALYAKPEGAIKAGRSMVNRRLKNIAAAQNEIGKQIDALNKAEASAKGASGRAQRTNNNED